MLAKMNKYSEWVSETRPDILVAHYREMLLECGFKICSEQYKFFEPFGFTALFLLSESHFAIHTFPEQKKTYIELSSCVDTPFDNFMKAKEKPFVDYE